MTSPTHFPTRPVRRPRRSLLAGVLAAALAVTAGCGTSGPAGTAGDSAGGDAPAASGKLSLWVLQSDTQNPVLKARIDEFNKTSDVDIQMTTYVNDAYKQKLQVSMGSANAPDIFLNWGGGNLGQFVQAGQVLDLTEALGKQPEFAGRFLPSVLDVGKVDGKQYGLPMSGMQPMMLYYNTKVMSDNGLQPPKTYDELLTTVDKLKGAGKIPIALAGSQGWTELMYLMYLVDRNGGQQAFADIAAGKPGAWQAPAVLKSLQMCQELAKRGAFGTNFASINYDNTGASKLFATGKAAMHVMGSWEYASQLGDNPKFIKDKGMGWVPFPAVTGGSGDPAGVVGVPANYFSVSKSSKHPDVAVDFLVKTLASDVYVDGLINAGEVPAVKGTDAKLSGAANADFTTFVYGLVDKAPSFTLAWDQALAPSVGAEVNKNLQKLFLSQLSPEQFAAAMEKAQ